jgi:hypothetical protein
LEKRGADEGQHLLKIGIVTYKRELPETGMYNSGDLGKPQSGLHVRVRLKLIDKFSNWGMFEMRSTKEKGSQRVGCRRG